MFVCGYVCLCVSVCWCVCCVYACVCKRELVVCAVLLHLLHVSSAVVATVLTYISLARPPRTLVLFYLGSVE